MKPQEFQLLASRLAETGSFSSEFRSAISRSYYAVFNLGYNLLKDLGFTIPKNNEAHKEICKYFNNSSDTDLIEVAAKIDNLRTKRNHADYYLDRTDVEKKNNAKMHVHSAERMMSTLMNCCAGEKRDQIIKAMADWKNKISL